MSENIKEINIFLREKKCCQPYLQSGFIHPTPEEIKDLFKYTGWKQSFIAQLLGVGESTLRKWTLSEDSSAHRKIPYSAWRLILGYVGMPTSRVEAQKLHEQWKNKK